MSADCGYYENLIFSLPDEGLTDSEAARLREHLQTCPDCRRLFSAFRDAAGVLRNDQAEAPAALQEGVMSRILAYEKVRGETAPETEVKTAGTSAPQAGETAAAPEAEPISLEEVRKEKRSSRKARRWIPVAAAACLVAVIGAGGAVMGLFGPKHAASETVVLEEAPAVLSEEFALADGAAAPEAAMKSEAAAEEAPAEFAAPMPLPEEEMPMADMAEEEAAGGTDAALFAARNTGHPVYTWEDPAQVPEGREADFQALLGAADMPAGLTEEDFQLFTAVEFHGVIYEFLQDETETTMLWRDAAESTYALPSPGTPADLWDIIG